MNFRPWIVLIFRDINSEDNFVSIGIRRITTQETGQVFFQPAEKERTWDNHGDYGLTKYFFDTEQDAENFVRIAIRSNPGSSFLIAKSKTVVYQEPGPQKRGSFTDAGFVPE